MNATPGSNSDGGSVQKIPGGYQNQLGPVLNSATSETNMSETKESESVIEDEKETESLTSKKSDNDYFNVK